MMDDVRTVRLVGRMGNIARTTCMPQFKNRLANLYRNDGVFLSICNESNQSGGDNVGITATASVTAVASEAGDDDDGGGDSDPEPERQPHYRNNQQYLNNAVSTFLFGGAK